MLPPISKYSSISRPRQRAQNRPNSGAAGPAGSTLSNCIPAPPPGAPTPSSVAMDDKDTLGSGPWEGPAPPATGSDQQSWSSPTRNYFAGGTTPQAMRSPPPPSGLGVSL